MKLIFIPEAHLYSVWYLILNAMNREKESTLNDSAGNLVDIFLLLSDLYHDKYIAERFKPLSAIKKQKSYTMFILRRKKLRLQ